MNIYHTFFGAAETAVTAVKDIKKEKPLDKYVIEENKVRERIKALLGKKGIEVSMGANSKKYIITSPPMANPNDEITIIVDGGAETIKFSNHYYKYGWKYTDSFINEMIQLCLDWIDADRVAKLEKVHANEMALLDLIGAKIENFENEVLILKEA